MSARAPRRELKGGHVLVAMLLFFGAIIAINVAFSIVAFRSFPGEDERRSYLQGLRYNDTLAKREAQAALGWTAAMDMTPRGRDAILTVRFADRKGRSIDDLVVTGRLRRPATTRADRSVVFTAGGVGDYTADAGTIPAGGWTFQGQATRGPDRFEFERRLIWTPPR